MADLDLRVDGKGIGHIDKDPNAVLDYLYRFTEWLEDGDEIQTASFPTPVGVTVDSFNVEDEYGRPTPDPDPDVPDIVVKTRSIVRAWISAGTVGQPASATCRIVTTGGRTLDRTIFFKIRQF